MSTAEERAARAAYMREWARKNRERLNAERKAKRTQNVEHVRAREREASARYRDAHRDTYNERQRAWTEANRDERREHARNWAKRNPEACLVNVHARLARLRAAPGRWTKEEWRDRCAEYGGVCPRCRKPCAKFTRDHIVPLSRDGTNWIWNLQPLCGPCNTSKNDRDEGFYPPPWYVW